MTLPVLMSKGLLISVRRTHTPKILVPSISGVIAAVHVLEAPQQVALH